MSVWRRLSGWLSAYSAHPDSRVAIANAVATVVVSNQPFYPLYLWLILGRTGWIGCATWLTTPFFAAVPVLARRNATAGRALLCGAGMANTLLCEKLLGIGSGVGWFALPCIGVAAASVRRGDWQVGLALAAACAAAGLVSLVVLGAPVIALGPAALVSLTRLHIVSVVSLLCVIAYLRFRAR